MTEKTFHTIPRIWGDYPAVCIASGSSLSDDDVDHVRRMREADKCRVVTMNNNFMKAPWADHLHFCDFQIFEWHGGNPDFVNFKGVKTTCSDCVPANVAGLLRMGKSGGLSDDPSCVATGGSSGYQSINIAALYGAKKIYLLGYEARHRNGRSHWFGSHPNPTDPLVFIEQQKAYPLMVDDLAKAGIEVINCSTHTAIECFPKGEIRGLLK